MKTGRSFRRFCGISLSVLACCLASGTFGLLPAAETKAGPPARRLFAAAAWPNDTGSAVNSSPVLGDLDGDGVLEIIVGADNNKVYAWKPDGTLMPGWPVTTGDSVRSSPALADLDRDGKLDVIVGSFDNKVYAWNFNGSLLPGWPVSTGSVVYSSPAVGDIDGDQLPEVVVGSFDNKVYAWHADGKLVRGWPKPTGLFVYSSPALADINKDGLPEVVIGTDNNRVFVWKGDGTEVEGWPAATEHVVPSSPAVGDLDKDGELEITAASWDQVFVWNSHGERRPGWPVKTGHQIASSPALADLNDDGKLDVIIGCKDGKVYAWEAGGSLLPGWPTVTDAEIAGSPVVADFDGDGKLKVAIGSRDGKVYIWDVQGRLLPGWPKNTGDAITASPAIADLDGNGTLELVIGSKDGKVYAWSFPRTGKAAPQIAWQNFHGDPAHTGRYGVPSASTLAAGAPAESRVIEITQTAETPRAIQVPPVQPGRPAEGTAPQAPVKLPEIQPKPITPREIKDGTVTDLSIATFDERQVTLAWTSPLGFRTAQIAYELRYAPEPLTEETWSSATPYPQTFRLAPAGKPETQTLTNLPAARKLYLALKVTDGAKSFPLSNVVLLDRPDAIPPAAIQGLQVTEPNETTLELSWQTTGDDGMAGAAATYDIRYADAPLDELTWMRATQITNAPAPLPAGSVQTFRIPQPSNDRELFFGIKAIDQALNISTLSNVAVWLPLNTIPPARISDLRLTDLRKTGLTLTWTVPGDNGKAGKAQRYDIRYADFPLTEASWEKAQPAPNPPLPENAGATQTATLPDIPVKAVRFIGLKAIGSNNQVSALSNIVEVAGQNIPPAAVADLKIEELGEDWARVSWTAPGTANKAAPALAYALKYDPNFAVVKAWEAARPVEEVPIPAAAGTVETATINGLVRETTYYVGLRVLDDLGNSSGPSNIVRFKTLKHLTPPDAVSDLSIAEAKRGEVTVNWTAPQEAGTEATPVNAYEIRYALAEITEANWQAAKKVAKPPKPSAPGASETFVAKGMPADAAYYLAVKSVDATGNVSALSNVLYVPEVDTTPPTPIVDLLVEEAGPDWAKISWTAPAEKPSGKPQIAAAGEEPSAAPARAYQIRVAPTLKLLQQQWEQAAEIPAATLQPAPAGAKETFTITGLKDKSTLYIAVRSVDEAGNLSEISNLVRAKTKDAAPPNAITDLQVVEVKGDAVVLKWTATGDDGNTGQAQAYDLRYALEPLAPENWDAAPQVEPVPRPAKAGATETATVTGLKSGTLYHFAVVAADASGNRSPLSNLIDALTADLTPPPPITTLRATNVADDAVTLTWLSPGNDENRNAPARYEIRYRQSDDGALDESTWAQSTLAQDPPVPSGKGTPEQFVLAGLPKNTAYAIGVKAFDEYDNVAELSNVAQVYTAPEQVTDLAILEFSMQAVTLTWTTPGGSIADRQGTYDIRYALTALTDDNWADALPVKTALPQDLSVKSPQQKEKVELTDLPPYDQLFFAIKVAYSSLAPSPNLGEGWGGVEERFSPLSNVVELNRLDIIPPAAVTDLKVADLGESGGKRTLQLSWTAPGDNDNQGAATKYDLRYGTVAPNEENWNTLTPLPDAPQPLAAGTAQQATAQLTTGEERLYFALKTIDKASNVSGLSNIADWAPLDTLSPAAITDLKVERVAGGEVTISWTAPGNNENRGTAAFYDIRYAPKADDVQKWDRAVVVSGEPLPQAAGTRQEFTLTGLQQHAMYYVAIKTADEAKNVAAMSNMVAIRTGDTVPPAQIKDLRVGKQTDDAVELVWTAAGDDGNSGRATAYALRYAMTAEELQKWDNAYEVANVPAPKNPGSAENYALKNLQPNTHYYFGIRTLDSVGNLGESSNVIDFVTADKEGAEPITDLAFVSGTQTSVTLSWKAPRDRGPAARVVKYDIRYAEDQTQLEQWNAARKVMQAIVPGEPGTLETLAIDKLAPNKRLYVAVKSLDPKGNLSASSNIAAAYTADTIPPQPIADLTVQTATANAVTLAWTVVADDPLHDQPAAYELRYSSAALDETNWAQAEKVTPLDAKMLQPLAPGLPMLYTVENLAENAIYSFAVRALDASGNVSPLSNVVAAQTKDVTAPRVITDLQAIFPTPNSILLSWTSPSDEQSSVGAASPESLTVGAYDIRYTTTPAADGVIDATAWEKAEKVVTPPKPQAPGAVEEFIVRNLEPGKTYYFAIEAIDQSGNIGAFSNSASETTLPANFVQALPAESSKPRADRQPPDTRALKPATAGTGTRAWDIWQGKEAGAIQKDSAGVFTLSQKTGTREISSVMTAVYPSGAQTLQIEQGELSLQMKSPQRFVLYVQVQAETGEIYTLCYTPDFGIQPPAAPIPSEEGILPTPGPSQEGILPTPVPSQEGNIPTPAPSEEGTRLRKRVENYVFFPLDTALLDNQWHTLRMNLAQDLFDGTGQIYARTLRFALRGSDVAFRTMRMNGPILTKLDDFEGSRTPFENGWNIHFGSGAVQVLKESAAGNLKIPVSGGSQIAAIKVRSKQANAFLAVKADSYKGIVLTYPKEGLGQLSDKPFFLAEVQAVGDFKLILKVTAKDNREYYLAYLPAAALEQAKVSGNYLYLPLSVEFGAEGADSAAWQQIQVNIAQDMRNHGLEYAYTSWISFHGQEFSLDNVGFSTDIVETAIE